ncbi:NAD(P)-dependent dehydrogenase (short-subunit alcohol dehydrogenase family) [Chryseobacterium ginsenosidimutans]|uniref:SDR family NAD(P)-dependent oxidoreductase n=1 Tax=Chryseobacterium ginsenosidimutans TaxID=687846 RepID=UPI0027863AEF|nr:SDR family oxidoreductase [Chryseobacterium ginsenosidimutans]MDQ0595262.1 NAD(P)-dependent dehydrogenase (short-subunit alcohol dehydrogenase family) [Chryseobacterium ginsenosidimutans]
MWQVLTCTSMAVQPNIDLLFLNLEIMKKLENKVAVITGGSSGIGLATAKKFVEEGAFVYITGRKQSELDKAVKQIGNNVSAVQGDISNLDDLDKLFRLIKDEKGSLDIVIANAGYVAMVPTDEVTPEHFDKTFDTNARGTFFTVQKAITMLNKGGSIVVVSSCVKDMGLPYYPEYAATKAAECSYVKTWACDLAARNIRANSVSPGPIETPFVNNQFGNKEAAEAGKAQFAELVPMKRLGKSEEVASTILFLASSDSSYITGADIPVDGGLTQIK